MKRKIWIIFLFGLTISCYKAPDTESDHDADSVMTVDSAVSGVSEITTDSLDGTLPVDRTDYDVDSIKNIK